MKCNHNVDLIPDASEIAELKEGLCPVDWARRVVAIARRENCGKSVMCRDGMTQLQEILTDVTTGGGQSDDLELIKDICQAIVNAGGCEIAEKAASDVMASMDKYYDEWDIHCRRKRCTALACESYYSVYIDPETCTGCTACARDGVAGGDGLIHVIMNDSALKTEEFFGICPVGAIKKAGAIKPKTPEEPVPVGSFTGAAEGGTRRRRRG